ncbi:hypothetical protein BAE44_0022594 [Dichanthelium oligosanthes]|uniref:Uncharacterized protein n=1 Tax=Dichanthelium oligosanthes TaxID=888268 RepID=A0A1E5UU51_9POAL|nr:hypothetical protein BAE44_0022594 [Dichanthelium oligosanthes]
MLGGIFISVARVPEPPLFFVPPSMSRRVTSYMEKDDDGGWGIPMIFGCCNSLLLLAEHEKLEEGSEWSPSPCIMWVYSSTSGR